MTDAARADPSARRTQLPGLVQHLAPRRVRPSLRFWREAIATHGFDDEVGAVSRSAPAAGKRAIGCAFRHIPQLLHEPVALGVGVEDSGRPNLRRQRTTSGNRLGSRRRFSFRTRLPNVYCWRS